MPTSSPGASGSTLPPAIATPSAGAGRSALGNGPMSSCSTRDVLQPRPRTRRRQPDFCDIFLDTYRGRTFNALTGAPLARLRQRAQWLAQARALTEGLSVRQTAAQMGVHRTTAFRWSHRFLQLPAKVRATALAGVAEGDET